MCERVCLNLGAFHLLGDYCSIRSNCNAEQSMIHEVRAVQSALEVQKSEPSYQLGKSENVLEVRLYVSGSYKDSLDFSRRSWSWDRYFREREDYEKSKEWAGARMFWESVAQLRP